MQDSDYEIYKDVTEYCRKYNIPVESLVEILEDQKVLPMIRGKATEYVATAILKKLLSRNWLVQKLNLNPQQGGNAEDISVTHSRTGHRMKVEAKNAVRGSFKLGKKNAKIDAPHFRVKCHKSRSHLKKSETTNDRYLLGEFDLIVCNVSNAIFQGGTLGDDLEVLHDVTAVDYLKTHYGVKSNEELIRCAYDDWRCCFPRTIIQSDGSVPRTPVVKLSDDESWFSLNDLEPKLLSELKHIKCM